MKRLLLLALCGASAVAAAGAAPPQQAGLRLGEIRQLALDRATPSGETETSTNWAGYAIRHRKPFASATGRWVQPTAACDAGTQTYSAFWVGLGGFSRTSRAVEQTGTQANCSGGTASYGAWYELYPAPPVELTLRIRPGDKMSATVTVNKKIVVIRLKNVTTGKVFARRLHMSRPDQSSAEWVAEAPTGCDYAGNCATLPLTNFGTVAFSHGTATVKGHKGRISDPVWSATTIELHGDLDDPDRPSAAGANAIPGALGADGGSFSITWQGLPPAPAG